MGQLTRGIVAGLLLIGSAGAHAQSNFERNRNVSVAERPRPLYDPMGLQLGGFTLKPQLNVGLEYNDNIFAQSSPKTNDTIVTVRPDVQLSSNWSRHQFGLYALVANRSYIDNDTDSTTDWTVRANGRVDIERAKLLLGASYGYFTEPRTSTNTSRVAAKPVRFYTGTGFGELSREFSYFKLAARVDYRDLDYKNAFDGLGALVLQDNRDYDAVTYSGRAYVAISPATAFFVSGAYNKRQYKLNVVGQPVRDSDGWDIGGGISFDLTNLMRGEIRVGYLRQSYADPAYGKSTGLSGEALISWFPTQLTTVTARASRSVEETSDIRSSGFLSGSGGLTVDHELLRNVILSAGVGFTYDEYQDIDRTDKGFTGSLSGTYMMNRVIAFSVGYDYLSQRSSGLDRNPNYKVNRIIVGTKIRY